MPLEMLTNTYLLTGHTQDSNRSSAVKYSPVVGERFLSITHTKASGYGKGNLNELENVRIFALIPLGISLKCHWME